MTDFHVSIGIIRSFKARYRRKLVRWLLDALHAKIDRKINILEAIRFAISSWEEIPAETIRNCWEKCDIVDAVTAATMAQQRNYHQALHRSVEDELATLMEALQCSMSISEYIDVDSEETIEGSDETIERCDSNGCGEQGGGDSGDEAVMKPSDALASCMQLASFLALQHDSDEIAKKLASVTEYVRKQSALRKKQVEISSFFNTEP